MSSGGFEAQCAHTHTHVHIKNRIVAVGFTTNQRNNNKHKTVRFNKWVFIFLLRSFFRHFTSISIRFSLSLWTMRSSVMVNSEWDTFRWDLMTCFWWPCYGSHIRNASIFSKVFYEFLAFWVDLQINCMCVLQLIRSVIFLCWWNDGKKKLLMTANAVRWATNNECFLHDYACLNMYGWDTSSYMNVWNIEYILENGFFVFFLLLLPELHILCRPTECRPNNLTWQFTYSIKRILCVYLFMF